MDTKKYTFYVHGTHCASCKILIEDIIHEQDFIQKVQVNLKKEIVEIETNSNKSSEEILDVLNSKIKNNGYILSTEKIIKENRLVNNLFISNSLDIKVNY